MTKPALGGVRVARSFDKADIAVPQSRMSLGIANQVFQSGRALLSVDAGHDDSLKKRDRDAYAPKLAWLRDHLAPLGSQLSPANASAVSAEA